MDELNLVTETTVGGKLRVFSLHLDFPASIRARWATSTILKLAGEQWVSSTEMWKMESLLSANSIRKMITDEAAKADIIIVAMSFLDRREQELIQWLESLACSTAQQPLPGLLIGLFGDENQQARELDWTVKHFMACAQNTNRDFIWHWMEETASGEPEWIVNHLETFLTRKLAALDHHHLEEIAMEFA
jgi:hypothetical protein